MYQKAAACFDPQTRCINNKVEVLGFVASRRSDSCLFQIPNQHQSYKFLYLGLGRLDSCRPGSATCIERVCILR